MLYPGKAQINEQVFVLYEDDFIVKMLTFRNFCNAIKNDRQTIILRCALSMLEENVLFYLTESSTSLSWPFVVKKGGVFKEFPPKLHMT